MSKEYTEDVTDKKKRIRTCEGEEMCPWKTVRKEKYWSGFKFVSLT